MVIPLVIFLLDILMIGFICLIYIVDLN